jgi:hypothetical protein
MKVIRFFKVLLIPISIIAMYFADLGFLSLIGHPSNGTLAVYLYAFSFTAAIALSGYLLFLDYEKETIR